MGRALCEKHGKQGLKLVCPHVVPAGPGSLIRMMGGHVPVLACDACITNFAVDGLVPDGLEEEFSATLWSWCWRCWEDTARGDPTSPS